MEWAVAILCMIPAAVSDVKYRAVSLESCVAALLAGSAVFALWAMRAPPADVVQSGIVAAGMAAAAWAAGRRGPGDGDWWFVAGTAAALSTLGIFVPLVAMACGMGMMLACHVAMCVRRPGIPYPSRLYRHTKRKGDKFRVDVRSGEIVDPGESGMVVYPGLPMVAFVVGAAAAAGAHAHL